MPSSLRFLHHYLSRSAGAVVATATAFERGGERLDATLYRPSRTTAPGPGWVVLHGLTVRGREHAALDRFARAVAAAGTVVLVPDIPEWRRLEVAPAITVHTIAAAVRALEASEFVIPERSGILGFSFGATQALVAAADSRLDGLLHGIVSWGGYMDLHRLFEFGLTGEHELDGRHYRSEPDPYGRWIMAGNYLTRVPGHEDAAPVADALLRLAMEAGLQGHFAGDPVYDPLKAELRTTLPPEHRALYDVFAHPVGAPPRDLDHARALAMRLADAALFADPLLDPQPSLPRLRGRVRTLLAHGRDDRLVPFTESLRLARELEGDGYCGCTITALFAHSGGTAPGLGPLGLSREGLRFMRMLRALFTIL